MATTAIRPRVYTGILVGSYAVPFKADRTAIDYFELDVAPDGDPRDFQVFVTRDGSIFDQACDLGNERVDVHWHKGNTHGKACKVIDRIGRPANLFEPSTAADPRR